jgi:hypothetical protein
VCGRIFLFLLAEIGVAVGKRSGGETVCGLYLDSRCADSTIGKLSTSSSEDCLDSEDYGRVTHDQNRPGLPVPSGCAAAVARRMMSRPSESQTRYARGIHRHRPPSAFRASGCSCIHDGLACSHCGRSFLARTDAGSLRWSLDGTKACNKAEDLIELPDVELTVLPAVEVEGVDIVAFTGSPSAVKVNSRAVKLQLRHYDAAGSLVFERWLSVHC